MTIWLVRTVYGEPLTPFSTREKALNYIQRNIGGVVNPLTPSTDLLEMRVDSELPALAA